MDLAAAERIYPSRHWFAQVNVESQEAGDSTLNLYRKAIALRKASFSTDLRSSGSDLGPNCNCLRAGRNRLRHEFWEGTA
jgi:hypothetical protein